MTRLFRFLRVALLVSLGLFGHFMGIANAASPPLQPEEAFALSVTPSDDGSQVLSWQIAEGYYLYRGRFLAEKPDATAIPMALPDGERHDDPYFGSEEIYRSGVTATISAQDEPITLTWQGCQQDGICYAPQMARLDVDGTVSPLPMGGEPSTEGAVSAFSEADGAAWSPGGEKHYSDPAAADLTLAQNDGLIEGLALRGGNALVIAGFLGFGLLLSFTPCVLPMVPIVAGMLAGQGEPLTARRGLVLTGAYVLAMASAFGALGVAAAWSGANLQVALQSPWALSVVAILFVALALSMFGLYELQMPAGLQRRLGQVGGRRGSVTGAAGLGFTSALIVGPCVTAPLAGALIYIAQTGDVMLGAAALFALGLGQGLPLLAVGAFGPQILPRSGIWMERVKQVFGVIFLAFAVWLAGRVLPGPVTLALWATLLVAAGVFLGAMDRLERGSSVRVRFSAALGVLLAFTGIMQGVGAALGADDPLRPLAPLAGRSVPVADAAEASFASVTTSGELDQALASAEGRPALVYVTADWCVTCRTIERGALSDPAVMAALDGLAPIKVDVSEFNAEAQALMGRLAAAGPPTMVFLDAARAEAPASRLIGDVEAEDMLASIDKVR
ncbi:protein-disulfide reductase DsbD [Paracoccus albicereus]|nr:protein-disulfide reductase DsbD [Paracoccus albicereus]